MDIVEQRPSQNTHSARPAAGRMKFLIGAALIITAVVYLVWTTSTSNAQYFMTVDEILAKGSELNGRELRVSGAVIGDSIKYDSKNLRLEFDVAHMPGNQKEIDAQGGMMAVLQAAVADPNRNHLKVVYTGVKPDLLKNEAQAIMTGKLGKDGTFNATELLLKCPTRYQEAVPDQAGGK
jgi:cytochrome c-type biogenesis protein CcmE